MCMSFCGHPDCKEEIGIVCRYCAGCNKIIRAPSTAQESRNSLSREFDFRDSSPTPPESAIIRQIEATVFPLPRRNICYDCWKCEDCHKNFGNNGFALYCVNIGKYGKQTYICIYCYNKRNTFLPPTICNTDEEEDTEDDTEDTENV